MTFFFFRRFLYFVVIFYFLFFMHHSSYLYNLTVQKFGWPKVYILGQPKYG